MKKILFSTILKFLKNYKILLVITLLVFVVSAGYLVYGIFFIIDNINTALSQQTEVEKEATYFDIDALETIKDKLE